MHKTQIIRSAASTNQKTSKMTTPPTPPSARPPASMTKPQKPLLRVVIADDHHHVLPEIHLAIRRRVLPFHGIHIVHFDAHPDLSFSSSIDAAVVFDPESLYDALDDSPSGIAEFLLPLVAAGHVDRVTWIKSPWATQMKAGDAMDGIALGRVSCSSEQPSRLSVDCPWPHFIDDDLYAPRDAMDTASIKLWDLSVAELPVAVATPSQWVLDVDLDFFSTWNPFRKDLETHFGADAVDLLTQVFTLPRYKASASALTLTADQRIAERRAFLDAMACVQHQRLYEHPTSADALNAFSTLASLYADDAVDTLTRFAEFLRSVASDSELLALVWNAAPCLDLPHHESSDDELERLLSQFKDFIRAADSPPALVTVASSVSDRFLPPHQLDAVRSRVVAILQELLGPLQVDEIEYEPVDE